MYILAAVAADARDLCLAIGFATLVAVFACNLGVCALQRKVGRAVVKTARRQIDDVGVAALVVGMAGAALSLVRIGHVAVIAALRGNVLRNVLVTRET